MAHKIEQLLNDPELRDRMGKFGRNRVLKELEWQYEAPKLLATYNTIFAVS